jgi:hypothetical protein
LPASAGRNGSIDTDMTTPSDKKPPRPPSKAGKGEKAFDTWLKQGLHKLYDDIASEPIPELLLKMIEEDRKK